jgi:hypothetical protein
MDFGHYVHTVHHDRFVLRSSQCYVQNGAFLGDIDLLTAKHGIDPLAQARLMGEFEQQGDRLISDAVLRVVEVETYGFERKVLSALWILREKAAEVHILYLGIMLSQSLPGGAFAERDRSSLRSWDRDHFYASTQ